MTIREYLAQFDWQYMTNIGMKAFIKQVEAEYPDLDKDYRFFEMIRWMNSVRTDGGFTDVVMSYEKKDE